MKISSESRELAVFLSIIVLITLIFSFVMFGITGLRVALGVIAVSLPFYLMLNKIDITQGEKVVFSILLGITIFPSFVYLLGFLVSFRIAILIVFILLMCIASLFNFF